MKRVLLILSVAALLSTSCRPDVIEITDDPVDTSEIDNDDDNDPTEAEGDGDLIDGVSFGRTIGIVWNGSSVSVSGDDNGVVSVNGAGVTVDNRSHDEIVRFELSGSSSNGFLKIYGIRKQALVLKGLELINKSGAAINNQSHKRTFVVLEGSNKLSDGTVTAGGDYTDQSAGEDCKAAFFSEGQLVFSGGGSLEVEASGKGAITSDDYLRFLGTQTVKASSSAGHALRGKDGITIDDGTISAVASAAGKKGLSSDAAVTINGGSVTVIVSGGTVSEQVTTDGVTTTEYTGSAGIKADSTFVMTGGVLDVTSSGQGGKGISGDKDARFEGGVVTVKVTGSNLGGSGTRAPGGGGGWPGGGAGGGGSSNLKSAKGIKFDGDIQISGGSVEVSAASHEALETKGKLDVTGGVLYAYSASDDAINSAGDMTLSGGFVCGWSAGNDGIDANGNMYVKGARVYAVSTKGSPEVAMDANTEGGKKIYLQSGTLVAVGGIESGSSISGNAYSCNSWSRNSVHVVCDASGNAMFAFKTPASGGSSGLVVYVDGKTASVRAGVSVSDGKEIWGGNGWSSGTATGGSSVSLTTYSGNSGHR